MGPGKKDAAQPWLKLLDGTLPMGETVELNVLSESMLPVFRPGSSIKVERVSWNACSAGDIIVFWQGRRLIAHRLLASVAAVKRRYLYQKGDASQSGHFIRAERVVGRVVEYQDEAGHYQTLRSKAAQRTARAEAFRQVLRAVWMHARRTVGGKRSGT